ncbi:tRNA (N(6)-L-threonylcarbamoyladenosine(37)-C(2))-methylthiotransferase [Candidatus Woesearchaeota archaeon]|jgi:threonylcarbamoyladenosine tRNA methylthiotransferase CDKAL1|nr:tRNA (N(6)-L-threonylcarbamoyladenosine(37)-C(2))-methylthiotransferase [Candidatus Woesearchaeota archaeon]MBT4114647.1 tRNA (N(6)-L-threonylcarbamoyladenosine(37)-C(2))-methylthiotransferase [Candidatus Woesearchaeota archaeon]MBT4248069.1 tRNA (N(6)-L-threonylcarbamoyladenosine(37)-C(2))-methylthiotransferase [Candidatus Woesearchaeota archaeon]
MNIHIYTQGCTSNQSDSEVMAGLLTRAGYELSDLKSADLVIFNTCSLKTPTESRLFRKIYDHAKNKKVIIAGCFPLSFPDDLRLKNYSLIGSFDLKHVVDAVERTLCGERVILLSRKAEDKLCLPKIRDKPKLAKVVISKGCLSNCSFCAGKRARGNLVSYDPEKIVEEVRQAVKKGCNKIYLTSQDTGCYGMDCDTNLIHLVKNVVSVDGNFKIRIGMMSPQWALHLQPALLEIMKYEKVRKFLHIPVQSGSNNVLKLMNRNYTVADFKKIVTTFRKAFPESTLATDIIVGFPGETETDFQETVKLLAWLQPEVLNLTRYWPRKGTPAGELKQLPRKIVSERSIILHNLFENIKKKRKEKGAPLQRVIRSKCV